MQYTEPDNQQKVWYVMRSLYRTELRTQALLQKAGIRSFIPVKETIVTSGGRRKRAKVPSVSNLIFVHSTQKELSPFTGADSRFQYTFRRGGLSNEPLIVPERQMEDFIRVCETAGRPLYFSPGEVNLAKGTRIRIIGGPLNGCEGILLKVSGARAKRLVVSIQDTLSVAAEVSPDLIEVI